MGAARYLKELWNKKQSDVLRYLHRIRTWEYRQLPTICRVTRPTRIDKAHRIGYRAKQGYLVYRVRVRRGDRKKKVSKVLQKIEGISTHFYVFLMIHYPSFHLGCYSMI